MMNSKVIYQKPNNLMRLIFALAVFLFTTTAFADVINNPVQHFLATYETEPGDELLKLEVDINGDGRNEVLLSLSKSYAYKSGHLWVVYIGVQGGYTEAKGIGETGEVLEHPMVSFRPDVYYVGQITEIHRRGIVSYVPGGGGKGYLKAITINAGKVRETDLGEIAPQGADKAKYDRYFSKAPSVQIQKLPIP